MISKIYNKSNTKILLFVIIIFVLFVAVVLPYFADLSTRLIGVAESPDTNFSFDLKFLYDLREDYGEYGRRIYLILRFTFDLVWPIVYTSFLLILLIELMKKTNKKYIILYIPIVGMLFDYLENIFASLFMVLYPKTVNFIAYLLMGSSILKWTFLMLGFIMVFYYLILLLLKKIKPSN